MTVSPLLRKLISKIDEANVKGAMLGAHLMTLYALARHATGPIVECGVGSGFSTLALLAGATDAGLSLVSYDVDPARHAVAVRNWQLEATDPLLERWRFVQASSEAAAAHWNDGGVGLMFLDTSHVYRETKRELFVWGPKIRLDGVICGHDCLLHFDPRWPPKGVKPAVDAFVARTGRFDLQVLRRDHGLFILWPKGAPSLSP